MFEQNQRLKAIWQYLVFNLIKGPLSLKQTMEDTSSDFAELNPLITLIGERADNNYVLKIQKNEQQVQLPNFVIKAEKVVQDLKELEQEV